MKLSITFYHIYTSSKFKKVCVRLAYVIGNMRPGWLISIHQLCLLESDICLKHAGLSVTQLKLVVSACEVTYIPYCV